ncbi:peptidase C45 [Rubinisphaera italica]|uniref:Acyl-coenzyme A:6-aminopenicillanic acid acyl-transferase n=1 Tax=Rubinisphaera italica TaxID=2527969 RepID=A0A5C5XA28_9PLAN|nr:peptidase C45 [Rubinisphaera italica]TWT59644.1 hypothetical protein Pan54_03520 [Rubinisphaera italica]
MRAREKQLTIRTSMILWGALIAFLPSVVTACTTAVISGRATVDGRPILWKNRDTSSRRNEVAFLEGGKYRAIAVVNAGSRSSAWMGVNEAGFCIENSLSKDLNTDGERSGPGNGGFMKLALETCRTVEEFRQLLEKTNTSGRRTNSNFGVIDAQGGAALFETGATSFKMFDANDPAIAPNGYLVRSNFATTAQEVSPQPSLEELSGKTLYSADRFSQACTLLSSPGEAGVSVEYMIRNVCRDLSDAPGAAVCGSVNDPSGKLPEIINADSMISRTTTVSAAVFHGVKAGEDPLMTTMWAFLGDPKFSIAVPCWTSMSDIAPPLVGEKEAPIGAIANTMRGWSFVDGDKGVDSTVLTGIWSDVWKVEDQILSATARARSKWESKGVNPRDMNAVHMESARRSYQAMLTELRQLKNAALTIKTPAPPKFEPVTKTILVP